MWARILETSIRSGSGAQMRSGRWIGKQAMRRRASECLGEMQARQGVIFFRHLFHGGSFAASVEFKIHSYGHGAQILRPRATVLSSPGKRTPSLRRRMLLHSRGPLNAIVPRDHVLANCVGDFTDARCGILGSRAPFEPEREGFARLGISNSRRHRPRYAPTKDCARFCFSAPAGPARPVMPIAREDA